MTPNFVESSFQPVSYQEEPQASTPLEQTLQPRTPLRPYVETPIHPPQITPFQTQQVRAPQPSQPRQQPPATHQTPNPSAQQQNRSWQPPKPAPQRPQRPQFVYHRIDPTKTGPAQESSYASHGAVPQAVDFQRPWQNQQQANDEDAAIQHGESGSEDAGEGTSDVNGAPAAPLVQPITPLQYPIVRPNLMLGPYDTHEEARSVAIEYAITQGYMLVQAGCARGKHPRGGHETGRPIVRVDMICDRSGLCRNVGTGKRKRATHKTGCPARFKIISRRRDASKWFIDPVMEMHNHDLNLGNMDSIASYRRYRRVQEGGPSAETRKDRIEWKKRAERDPPNVPSPAPAQVSSRAPHNTGPTAGPTAGPTGPLHTAAFRGHTTIIGVLLNKGGDIDAYDSTGRTALHSALEGSRMDAFKLLIERGANVSRCDSKGLSPLHVAVEKGLEEAVVLLIEKGADPNM